jgi:hypothetical protein
MTILSLVKDKELYLESRKGSVKTIKEWKEECTQFYKEIGKEDVRDQWGRFSRILGLHEVGVKVIDFRKPVRAQREGLTSWGYEHE